jgi:hypothetical protein
MAMTTSSSIKVKAALDREPSIFVHIKVPSNMRLSDNRAALSESRCSPNYTIRSIVAISLARFLSWIEKPAAEYRRVSAAGTCRADHCGELHSSSTDQ